MSFFVRKTYLKIFNNYFSTILKNDKLIFCIVYRENKMQKVKIAIGCDHAGFHLKSKIIEYLNQKEIAFEDFGIYEKEASDYPIIAHKVAQEVATGQFDRGILVCGTGQGMGMTANKTKGIRAVCISDTFSARASRTHNDANILCLGERVTGDCLALDIVDIWIKTPFEGGRHQKRIDMIE